jgi:hypothetical protein
VSEPVPTHRNRAFPIEAWQFTGQPYSTWPHWILDQYANSTMKPKPERGTWALRDDEGDFWRWMDARTFADRYEALP